MTNYIDNIYIYLHKFYMQHTLTPPTSVNDIVNNPSIILEDLIITFAVGFNETAFLLLISNKAKLTKSLPYTQKLEYDKLLELMNIFL